MIRSLKFVYDLGVRHERVRIAAHLKTMASHRLENAATYRGVFDDADAKMSKDRKQKLLRAAELEEAVNAVINEILAPNWEQHQSASIMFPDDKHKGEL